MHDDLIFPFEMRNPANAPTLGLMFIHCLGITRSDATFSDSDIRYTISPYWAVGVESSSDTTIESTDQAERTTKDRNGIRVRVLQTGVIGQANAQALLIQLVTSMALLAVSTTIVQTLALHACPLRHIYAQYITATSPDLYDVRGISEVRSKMNRNAIMPRFLQAFPVINVTLSLQFVHANFLLRRLCLLDSQLKIWSTLSLPYSSLPDYKMMTTQPAWKLASDRSQRA